MLASRFAAREFIARVYGNRKVVATRMNEGSSRSHCAIILTLLQLETASQTFRQTQFSIVDLAGAERPEKALGYRISKEDAMRAFEHNFEVTNLPMLGWIEGATPCLSLRACAR